MRIIKSQEDFDDLLTDRLVVVDLGASDWCHACVKVAPLFAELAEKYPDVVFAKGDIDELEGCSCVSKIKAVPTFRFYREGTKVFEVVGGNIKDIEAGVIELIGQPDEVSAEPEPEPESEEHHSKGKEKSHKKKSHHRHVEKEMKEE